MPLSFEPHAQRSTLIDLVQAPDFTTTNYADKNIWSAFYGDEIEALKEHVQQKIKPEAVKAKLQELQSLVGRLTLSPVVYSLGLLDLQKFLRTEIKKSGIYLEVIKGIRREWRESLREQKAFALENFFTDVNQAINYVVEAKWEVQTAQDVLNYYFHLIDELVYQQTVAIAKNFFNEFFLKDFNEDEGIQVLMANDIQHILQQLQKLFQAAVSKLPVIKVINEEIPTKSSLDKVWSITRGIGQYVFDHPVQSIAMGLAVQTAAVAAFTAPRSFNKRAVGDEFLVNTYTNSAQRYPAVARLSNDNFVVTWTSWGQDSNDYGVYAQLFNNTGGFIGTEFRANTYTLNYQQFSDVAGLSNGNFVIVWESNLQDGNGYGVYGQLFNSTGGFIGTEFRANNYTLNYQQLPAVASLGNGNFVVTWQSDGQDGNSYGIYAQLFNSTGGFIGTEFRANTYTNGTQNGPAVAGLSNGNFVITWAGDGQDDSSGIYAQLFNGTGSFIGSPFRANTYTNGTQSVPAIASLSNGNFVITWESYGQGISTSSVYGQLFNSSAGFISAEFQTNTFGATFSSQDSSAVASLSNGNFVITWDSYGQDNSDEGVYGKVFNSSAGFISAEFRANTYTTNAQRIPDVVGLSNGNFVIVWESDMQDGSIHGIYGKIYSEALIPSASTTPSITPSNTPSASTTPSNTPSPSVTPSPTVTPTPTASITPSVSATPSMSPTSSRTPSSSITPTRSPSITPTPSNSPSRTPSVTPSINNTPSYTSSITPSTTVSPVVGDSSSSDSFQNELITAVASSLGSALVAGLVGLGFWKLKKSLDYNHSRRDNTFADRLRRYLNLSQVDDFNSEAGIDYTSATNQLQQALAAGGYDLSMMDSEKLDELIVHIAQAIRDNGHILESDTCYGLIIMPAELKRAIPEIVNYVEQQMAKPASPFVVITADADENKNQLEMKNLSSASHNNNQQPTDIQLTVANSEPKSRASGRINKGRTIIVDNLGVERFELINKIKSNDSIVDEIKEQTGIEITFTDESKKEKFVLGKGQFGKLRLAYDRKKGVYVGVKKIKNINGSTINAIETSKNEGLLQQKLLGCPHIMPLLDSVETTGSNDEPVLYQFMPLAGWGNGNHLTKRLQQAEDKSIKIKALIHASQSLLDGIAQMHQKHIYHLDIKPDNVVFDKHGYLYVIDFGCALELLNGVLSGGLADSRYFSPERFANYRYLLELNGQQITGPATEKAETIDAAKVDAWAVGVSLLEWLLGKYPFDKTSFNEKIAQWDNHYFEKKIDHIKQLNNPAQGSLEAVIKGLLDTNPSTRLTIEQALQMPIFKQPKYGFVKTSACEAAFAYLKHCSEAQESNEPIVVSITKENDTNYTRVQSYTQSHIQNENTASGTKDYQPIRGITHFQAANQMNNNPSDVGSRVNASKFVQSA